MRSSRDLLSACTLALILAACGGSDPQSTTAASTGGRADASLPSPVGAPGSAVTGRPDEPGPNGIREPGDELAAAEPAVALDENGNPLPADAVPADPAALPGAVADPSAAPATVAAPATAPIVDPALAQEAVAVVRDYHAAISAHAYARAYTLWADGGQASGQSAQQFADGFADIDAMSVEIAPPTRADAAIAQVPVTLTTRRRDGGERRLVGHYTLRRLPADAAGGAAWRIASTRLREAAP